MRTKHISDLKIVGSTIIVTAMLVNAYAFPVNDAFLLICGCASLVLLAIGVKNTPS